MSDEERRSHFATVRVELEDATDEEARWFWEAIQGGGGSVTCQTEQFEGTVVEVRPDA